MRTVYLIFAAATIAACLYILHTFGIAIANVSTVPVLLGAVPLAVPRSLLSVNADAKTSKGVKGGYLTGIMYLAPADASGFNTCKHATAGCRSACLFTAGRAAIFTAINASRIARTRLFFDDRYVFFVTLIREIRALIRKAEREELIPCVRLNGTSDIPWERIQIPDNEGGNIFDRFPNVQFYDYTKWPVGSRTVPTNYDLTFSRAESNEDHAIAALHAGQRIAVVFDTPKGRELPLMWHGHAVIDADTTDLRFRDPHAVVCGLRAKGDARSDRSGFVVHTNA